MLRKTFLLVVLIAVAAAFLPVLGETPAPPRVRAAIGQETTHEIVSAAVPIRLIHANGP